MKLPLSTIIVVALSVGVAWAEGPVEKAGDVAADAVDTAKNVGHKVVKGTKEVVHKVVGAATPNDGSHKFTADLPPNETKVLHIQLKRGTYTAYSSVDGNRKKGTETTLSVP
jgi:hypothetical protein